MAADLFALMWVPFLMCLVLTGIHAYLGIHVIAREVVFVDIALAQIAALGATAAFLFGFELDTWESYVGGLSFTILGALVLALTRSPARRVSQEAVIGVVYAVSAAAAVLLADRSPHGAEHLRGMLVGSILSVRGPEVLNVAGLYAIVGLVHYACRRPFFLISSDPAAAYREGWRVRWWDFLFYASFGVVVTSSVRIAGVLLVFSYLIVPALAGILLGGTLAMRLLVGWAFGTIVSILAITASAVLDLPTGATVVCAFGVSLLALAIGMKAAGVSALPPPLAPERPTHAEHAAHPGGEETTAVPAPPSRERRRPPRPAWPTTRALAGVGVLLVLLCATRAGAHPHAYVDYAIALRAGTQIENVGFVFTFDEQFSSLLRYHAQWQTGATPSERYAASLRQLPYEIDASYNGAHVALEDPEDVQFLDEGGRITCRFRVRLRTALVPPGVIEISVEDPGFYLAFALRAGDPAEVQASAPARLACQRGGASSGAPRGVRCVYRLAPD